MEKFKNSWIRLPYLNKIVSIFKDFEKEFIKFEIQVNQIVENVKSRNLESLKTVENKFY